MAPEQARAAGAIDHRADLYSLGCILYHMLVGRPPFVADGGGEIIALQMFGQVEPPSRLATVSPEMEQLVLRLLEKDPADRFQNAGELVLALAGLDPPLATSWPRQATRDTQRIRSRTGIIAGAIAVIVAVGVGLAVMMRGAGAPASLVPSSAAAIAPAIAPTATTPAATTPTAPTTTATASTSVIPAAPDRHPAAKRTARKRGEATPSTRPTTPDAPDKAIEVIHELRPADPPRPGEHTRDGSPIESDVELGRRRPSSRDPAAP
jgi:serine/threonine protein kinase